MARKFSKALIAEWTEELRRDLKPGDTLHTVLRGVSASGMTRYIDVYRLTCIDGKVEKWYYSPRVAAIAGYTFDEKRDCIKVEGCGMDMGFSLVYNLSRTLFPDGYKKADGTNCKDGGYALKQEWV